MSYFLHFKASNVCEISVNGESIGKLTTKPITLETDNLSSFILSINPISEKNKIMPSFSVKIAYELNHLFCTSNFVEVVPFSKNNYEILINFTDITPTFNIEKVYEKTLNNNLEVIVTNSGKSNVSVFKSGILKFATSITPCHTFNSYVKNDFVLIQGSNGQINHLLVLSPAFKCVYNDEMELVEFDKTSIKVLKKVCDIAKHGKVSTINYDTAKVSSHYVYLNEKNIVKANELVPYAFLQAVKIKNFDLAKEYLSDNLKSKLSESACEQFFGEINEIYFNPYVKNDVQLNYTIKGANYTSFNFKVKSCVIEEIEESQF